MAYIAAESRLPHSTARLEPVPAFCPRTEVALAERAPSGTVSLSYWPTINSTAEICVSAGYVERTAAIEIVQHDFSLGEVHTAWLHLTISES